MAKLRSSRDEPAFDIEPEIGRRLMQALEFSQLFLRLAPSRRQFIKGSTLSCEAGIRWG